MDLRIASIRRFLYSHYFFGGVRQAIGMLLPVLVLGGLFGHYATDWWPPSARNAWPSSTSPAVRNATAPTKCSAAPCWAR